MKITSITIKNVRSFKDEIKIAFDDKFNILIGPNGGGKSNLLDIITILIRNFLLVGYKIQDASYDSTNFFKIISHNPSFQMIDQELDKFSGDNGESTIELKLKVGKEDIENIHIWKLNQEKFETALNYYKGNVNNLLFLDSLNLENLIVNQELNFYIKNNSLVDQNLNSAENIFLQYLKYFELFLILSREIPDIKLNPMYLYFSPYRGDIQQNLQANLSSDNIDDLLKNYFASTSKSIASLVKLSSLYFAEKRRNYESQSQGYQTAWSNDKEVKLVTKYLKKLGYSWDLKLKDKNKNIYEIMLTKDDRDFYIGQASSGEKEIINFLFGIFAFNIKNGLIIVDEAELHLHPKWQSILIELFLDLSKDTGNQFILSTHSAVFINETTISNIIRIYKENNTSNAIAISKNNLNKTKDLLHIINSHNNEKMFFADKVVLVEGVKDRLIFQKIIDIYSSKFVEKPEIIEVLEVLGKSNLIKYREFLDSIKVKNYIIADNDYILTIGDEDVKKLFVTDYQKIDKEIIFDKKSMDSKCLAEKMESAISANDMKNLQELWQHIKNRKQKLKENLTLQELSTKRTFLNHNFQKKTYILEKGEIEDYLPNGYKDLNQVIELVKDESFLKIIENVKKQEINKIVFDILEIPCPK